MYYLHLLAKTVEKPNRLTDDLIKIINTQKPIHFNKINLEMGSNNGIVLGTRKVIF